MEILEVSADKYAEVIRTPYHAFGSADFSHLNKEKCDEVSYLLFRDGKFRLGIIGGRKNGVFHTPFSAPFGGFTFITNDVRLQYIEEALKQLKKWATERNFTSIKITLPPSVYDFNFYAKQVNCLWREGFEISDIDLNYSFDLECFDQKYPERIWHNARKNLRISMNAGFQFAICNNEEEKRNAYSIIQQNRESKGYPLRMSWQQVKDTVELIMADFFLVYNENHSPVASAIVFQVNESIVQVVYWGDFPGFTEMKPMNFLSFKVFEFYKNSGRKIVDIGPSTENSVPNYGLCEFKEGIGCKMDPKFTFILKLN